MSPGLSVSKACGATTKNTMDTKETVFVIFEPLVTFVVASAAT
jgi:hypothetical protein